jgi:hypothetical protein
MESKPTGELKKVPEMRPLPARDTRAKEHCDRQLKLYAPCSCGSGKKFKFCCVNKPMFVFNTDPS